MSRENWDLFFIKMAQLVASKSKDRSTKVGVVIVGPDHEILSMGFNGFPRGVNDDVEARHERPAKYAYTEHAERNAMFNAARAGIRLKGCTMYMNWHPTPCTDCARAVIQSGITTIVGPNRIFSPGKGVSKIDWEESFKYAREMMAEAGMQFRIIDTCQIAFPEGVLWEKPT